MAGCRILVIIALAGAGCSGKPAGSVDALLRPSLVYDPVAQRLLRFGGVRSGFPGSRFAGYALGEADASWVEVTGDGPRVQDAAIAFDLRTGHLVIHGGDTYHVDHGASSVGATWLWDRTRWTAIEPAGPGDRVASLAYFDNEDGHVILYGGLTDWSDAADDDAYFFDEWRWIGTRWESRAAPPGGVRSIGGCAAYDRERRALVLVVQDGSPTETWERRAGAWTMVDRGGLPQSRLVSPMAYDSKRHRTVVHGVGPGLDQTWSWDGITWTLTSSTGPSRAQGAIGYDEARDRLVITGGVGNDCPYFQDACASTWSFDGERWTELIAEPEPL